jgi:uncharacterized membrane protein YeiH
MRQALHDMQFILEHLGVAVAAVTGVLAARGKQVDLFGVLVLALVTALGGGTIRDVALGVRPVFWVSDGSYVLTAVITALATFFLARVRPLPRQILLVADACALAFFTMVGTRKALDFSVAPHIAVAMGVITGVAGGMCRDVLTGEIPLVFRRAIYLYATAAMVGAVVFVGLEKWLPGHPANLPLGAAITLALRLAAMRWKLGLPVYSDAGD